MDTVKNNLIEKFYQAFSHLDSETMSECYHEKVTFKDPAFGVLEGVRAKNMWRMLCKSQKGKDFNVKAYDIHVDGDRGTARWEAFYTFSKTGRKIHNIIDAEFEFSDGKIISHTDRFDLYRWSKQALGVKGFMMGWTAFFKRQLNAQTNKLLDRFEEKVSNSPVE